MKLSRCPYLRAWPSLALGLTALLLLCSCASLPPMSALPSVPNYDLAPLRYEGSSAVNFAVQDDSGYSEVISKYLVGADRKGRPIFRDITVQAPTLCTWLESALSELGYQPYQAADYVTRADRLKVDRVLLPHIGEFRKLQGKEGSVVDVRMQVMVYDPKALVPVSTNTAWGRKTVLHKRNRPFNVQEATEEACQTAIRNLTTLELFRKSMIPVTVPSSSGTPATP